MNEFELIQRCFSRPVTADWCRLGIGDDAALLTPPPGQQLVICTDTLVAGRHFPNSTRAFDIAWKSLAVNLSDLAAMGARPMGFLLNLTLPQVDEAWLEDFSQGLFALAAEFDVLLVGGDTTRGPLSISITAFGAVEPGNALLRSAAKVDDVIVVVGDLGGAAHALQVGEGASAKLREKLDRPVPQVSAGLALADVAHSAIDISDGLAADLSHILLASGVGAVLELDKLPLHPVLSELPLIQAQGLALHGGDDYALCLTMSVAAWEEFQTQDGFAATYIGRIIAQPGLYQREASDKLTVVPTHGYLHFT